MKRQKRSKLIKRNPAKAGCGQGQALIEYLLMTSMLLFLFVGLYRVLQNSLAQTFEKMGRAILYAYY